MNMHEYALTEVNLLVFDLRKQKFLRNGMEEGGHSVEQSIEAEVQGKALALQNMNGSATLAPTPAPQFPAQFAQKMAMFF